MSETPRALTEAEAHLVRTSTVVPRLARRISRRTTVLAEDDLRSIGHETEVGLAKRFDPNRGIDFEAFSYPPVRAEMTRAVATEKKRQARERLFSAADDYLEGKPDRGNIFEDSADESRAQAAEFASGILGSILMSVVSAASLAPSEEELHEHADALSARTRMRDALTSMGDTGQALKLRLDGHDWEEIATKLDTSTRTVRRYVETAVERVGAITALRPR